MTRTPQEPASRPSGRTSRRAVLAAATAGLMLPGLAACGPGSRSSGGSGLLVSWYGGQPVHDGVGAALDAFTAAHPDLEITREMAEFDDYWDKLATQTAGGEGPDAYRMSMSYFSEYAERGALLDLSDRIGEDEGSIDVSALDPEVASAGETGEGTFGIGQSSITHATFRNAALVQQHGASLPQDWTWEDFSTFCTDFAAEAGEGVYGSTDAGGDLQLFQVWARQHGTELFGPEGLGVAPETIEEWFTLWADLRAAGAVPPADITAEGGGFENSQLSLGAAAIAFGWVQQVTFYQPFLDSPLELAPVPGVSAGDLTGQFVTALDFWSIAQSTRSPDEASLLVDFLLTDEKAIDAIGLSLGVPPSQRSRDLLAEDPDSAAGRAIAYVEEISPLTGEPPEPWPSGYSQLLEGFSRTGEDIAFGRSDPAQGAQAVIDLAAEALGTS